MTDEATDVGPSSVSSHTRCNLMAAAAISNSPCTCSRPPSVDLSRRVSMHLQPQTHPALYLDLQKWLPHVASLVLIMEEVNLSSTSKGRPIGHVD